MVLVGDSLGMVDPGRRLHAAGHRGRDGLSHARRGARRAARAPGRRHALHELPGLGRGRHARRRPPDEGRAAPRRSSSRAASQVAELVRRLVARRHPGDGPRRHDAAVGPRSSAASRCRGAPTMQRDAHPRRTRARSRTPGAYAMVLEACRTRWPPRSPRAVPALTIGIGAGPDCDGQVLVMHDLLGLEPAWKPRFVRRYAELGKAVGERLRRLRRRRARRALPLGRRELRVTESPAPPAPRSLRAPSPRWRPGPTRRARAASASPSCRRWATCTPGTSRCSRRGAAAAIGWCCRSSSTRPSSAPNEDLGALSARSRRRPRPRPPAPASTSPSCPATATMYPPGLSDLRAGARAGEGAVRRAPPRSLRRRRHRGVQAVQHRAPARRAVRREGLPAAGGHPPHGRAIWTCRSRSWACRPCASPTAWRCRRATSTSRPTSAQRALALSRGLRAARARFDGRRTRRRHPDRRGARRRSRRRSTRIDYVELRDAETLAPIAERIAAPGRPRGRGVRRHHAPHRQHPPRLSPIRHSPVQRCGATCMPRRPRAEL